MYHTKFSILGLAIVGFNGIFASPSETVDPDTKDLVPSKRFPNNPWSYEACATPSIGSVLCPTAVVPAVVPVAPAAPVAPVHPTYPAAPTDIHPAAPHHPEVVVGAGPGLGGVLTGNYDPESIGDIRLGDASSKINLPPSK